LREMTKIDLKVDSVLITKGFKDEADIQERPPGILKSPPRNLDYPTGARSNRSRSNKSSARFNLSSSRNSYSNYSETKSRYRLPLIGAKPSNMNPSLKNLLVHIASDHGSIKEEGEIQNELVNEMTIN